MSDLSNEELDRIKLSPSVNDSPIQQLLPFPSSVSHNLNLDGNRCLVKNEQFVLPFSQIKSNCAPCVLNEQDALSQHSNTSNSGTNDTNKEDLISECSLYTTPTPTTATTNTTPETSTIESAEKQTFSTFIPEIKTTNDNNNSGSSRKSSRKRKKNTSVGEHIYSLIEIQRPICARAPKYAKANHGVPSHQISTKLQYNQTVCDLETMGNMTDEDILMAKQLYLQICSELVCNNIECFSQINKSINTHHYCCRNVIYVFNLTQAILLNVVMAIEYVSVVMNNNQTRQMKITVNFVTCARWTCSIRTKTDSYPHSDVFMLKAVVLSVHGTILITIKIVRRMKILVEVAKWKVRFSFFCFALRYFILFFLKKNQKTTLENRDME